MILMDLLKDLNNWFWNEKVWLPGNTSWESMTDTDTVKHAKFCDLWYAFGAALVFLVVGYTLERCVFCPVGYYFGLKPKIFKKDDNKIDNVVLEKPFRENQKMNYKQIKRVAKQLVWSERRVERWIRRMISREKPSTLTKFTESAWHFTFYSASFCYGLYCVWDEPWFGNSYYFWYEYPHHHVTNEIWWYYILELGFYLSLTVFHLTAIKRKDFFPLLLHHVVVVILLIISWVSSMFRIGTVTLVLHHSADISLKATKMAMCVRKQRIACACFVVFCTTWIVTRLGIYPYRILYSTIYEAPLVLCMSPIYYILNSFMCILLILHIRWTWIIAKRALRAVSSKTLVVKDIQSDSKENKRNSSKNDAHAKDH